MRNHSFVAWNQSRPHTALNVAGQKTDRELTRHHLLNVAQVWNATIIIMGQKDTCLKPFSWLARGSRTSMAMIFQSVSPAQG